MDRDQNSPETESQGHRSRSGVTVSEDDSAVGLTSILD